MFKPIGNLNHAISPWNLTQLVKNLTQPSTLFLTINAGTNVLPSEIPLVDLGQKTSY